MTNKTALAEAISAENKLKEVAGLRLSIASLSDIHFNHPNTPTEFIIRNINRYVFPIRQKLARWILFSLAGM